MNFQDSKFTKGGYKGGRSRPNRNWRGGGRGRNWRSTPYRYKEQHFSNSRRNFSPNCIYKFGKEFSTHSPPYAVLPQNVQSAFTKKEHIRPKSPFPGSEEYTQRNIAKASDFIKKQLEIDENVTAETYINSSQIDENLHTNHKEFPTYTDFKNDSSYSAKSNNVARCSDNEDYSVTYSPKQHSFNTSSHQKIKHQQMYDVSEIHNKLINHISNLSHAKKVNIINQVGPIGYDLAVQQIQKQKRIELSQALREMCKEQCFNEKTEAINSIIPDFDIPIESLPKEIIEKLSTSLDVNFDDANFSLPILCQTNNDNIEFPRNDFCVPDPIVPETYFQQAEDLLKDSLEYLPDCKQFKTDLFQEQIHDASDKFHQENTTLNDNSSFENLPDFKDLYQPSPQGLDMDQSNFQDDNVVLPYQFSMDNDTNIKFSDVRHDNSNNLKENINSEFISCEETTKEVNFIEKENHTVNTGSMSNTVDKIQDISNLNMNMIQQPLSSAGSGKGLPNEFVNAETKVGNTVEKYLKLQLTDDKPEKIHFEITSRQKLFNKKVCEHTSKRQSKEIDSNKFNVKTEKFNYTKETEFGTMGITEQLHIQEKQSNAELKNDDETKLNNKIQNILDSNKESDYFAKNDLIKKQTKTTALITEQSNSLSKTNSKNEGNVFINKPMQEMDKLNQQKNKILLNRDSYKETMKIINETDYYKHSSNNQSVKNKDEIGFSCLTKSFNPYTSYLKPSKMLLEQNKRQADQKGYKKATTLVSNSKITKEDLAIEEIVKGFSPKKKRQQAAQVQIFNFKDIDKSVDSTAKIVKKNKKREKQKNRYSKQKKAMKYVSNELEEELLQTAYKEMEKDNEYVKVNEPTNTKGVDSIDNKYSNSYSIDFPDTDKILESSLTNNTETTSSGKTTLADKTPQWNVKSHYSKCCNDNNKIPSSGSTIQSVYEYENEDLDYDYDTCSNINKSTVKGVDLKDDEMVRLWEKRAKDVQKVNEKNVLEDGKLWNHFVEKSAGNVTSINQDGGLILATNSKTDDVTLNFVEANESLSGNLQKNGTEKEGFYIEQSLQKLNKSEYLLQKDRETQDSSSNNIQEKLNIETSENLNGNNEIETDTTKTNTNLMETEENLKLDTHSLGSEGNSGVNNSNVTKLTTFCNDTLSKETKTEFIDNQLNDVKNENTTLNINQNQILDVDKNIGNITNNLIKEKNTFDLEDTYECHCVGERNIHNEEFHLENKHICSDKNSNSIQTKKDHRSSLRGSFKSSNNECKLEKYAPKEENSRKTPGAHKTSLNKLEFRKLNNTTEELAFANKEASLLEKSKSKNKSYPTSDDRKRKIRIRNNYSQTEKYSRKDIALQTENSRKECNDQIVQCEMDNSEAQFISSNSLTSIFDFSGINENSKLTRNDAITKLIEIDKQIDNLLKMRQDYYKILFIETDEKVHCKLPNASGETTIVTHKNNSSSIIEPNNLSDNSKLKVNSSKRGKLKKNVKLRGVNVDKRNQNIDTKRTASLILRDSAVTSKKNLIISSNNVGKLNIKDVIERKKVSSNSKDNLEFNRNKVLERTTHYDDVRTETVEHGHYASNKDKQKVNDMEELKTIAKNICITNKHSEVKNKQITTTTKEVPKDSVLVASESEDENVSLFSKKKKIVYGDFFIKKCNNKRNQLEMPTKRRKRKHSSFVTNKDKSLRQTKNNKTLTKMSSSKNENEQNTLILPQNGISQENNEEINKENCSIQKCKNVPYTSEIHLEKEIKQISSLGEPEHKRKRKNDKTEMANIETIIDKEGKLKDDISKEYIVEKCSTNELQKEENTIVNSKQCGNRNDLYEEMQKLKCIVRVERLSIEQVGDSIMPALQNFKTSQCSDEGSNIKMEYEFEHVSRLNEYNEDERTRVYVTNETFTGSQQIALKQSTIGINSQLKDENFINSELLKKEHNIDPDNLRVERYGGHIEFSSCPEKVDLTYSQNLKIEQKIASNEDFENKILISTSDVGDDLEEIFFKNFEGVILVIKVVSGVIIAASDKGKLFCYSMSSGLLLDIVNVCSVAITSLCVLKNKKEEEVLYTGSLDVKLNIYNFITKEKIKSENVGEPIQCMEYAWDYLFIGSDRGSIIRYDVQKEKIDYKEKIFDLNVLVLRATQEGARKVLVVAARNNPVSVRDAMSGLLMRTMETPFCPTVYTLLLEKNFVFCGTSQHDILVYTFEDGQLIFKHEATKSKGVVCMQIVKNLLFAGCYNGNVYIYNIKTNRHVGTMTGPGGLLLSMEIVNGKIIVGTKSNKFKLWTIPKHYLAENKSIT